MAQTSFSRHGKWTLIVMRENRPCIDCRISACPLHNQMKIWCSLKEMSPLPDLYSLFRHWISFSRETKLSNDSSGDGQYQYGVGDTYNGFSSNVWSGCADFMHQDASIIPQSCIIADGQVMDPYLGYSAGCDFTGQTHLNPTSSMTFPNYVDQNASCTLSMESAQSTYPTQPIHYT
jgi:hypothetical protein